MCDPVTLGVATAALAIGQQVTSYVGQNQVAKANEQAANLNYAQQKTTIAQKAVQLDQERSEKSLDTAIQTVQSEGKIAASASDQGLAPTSIIQAINANQFGIGRNASVDNINDRNARVQLANEAMGADISRQSQILQHPKASPLSLVLGVAQGGLSGYNAYSGAKKAGG